MSEKTDIAALRDLAERIKAAMASCVESFCMEVADSIESEIGRDLTEQEHQQISETASGLLVAKDKLEAEHQRADDAERAADNARSSRDLHHKVNAGLNERLIKAEAELAELRGEQEPVAWIKCGEVTTEPTTADVWIREMNEGYGYDVEVLCKRQPKPVVVLPAYKFCPSEYQGSLLWSETEMWNKAITAEKSAMETVGIVVKGGE